MPYPKAPLLVSRAFSVVLVYYWALQFAVSLNEPVEPGSIYYYLFVAPIAVFSLALFFTAGPRRLFSPPVVWMAVFAAVVSLVSIARSDLQTILSIGLFSITVAVVLAYRLTPSINLINILFIASIIANGLAFLYGNSVYSILPGFSIDEELWWRVSIFPGVASSAFFSLIVLLLNSVYKSGVLRRVCIFLAIYFFVFSGLRTALVAGLIVGLYFLLVKKGVIVRATTRFLYLVATIAVFVGLLFANELLLMLPSFGSEFLNVYIFRSDTGLANEGDVAKSVYRAWLWLEHFRISSENPIFGIGSFDFTTMAEYDPIIGEGGTGSESYLTALYARVGLSSLLLVVAFVSAMLRNARSTNDLTFMMGLMIFVAMLSYGSFITAYDFIFLVMIGVLSGGRCDSVDDCRPVFN